MVSIEYDEAEKQLNVRFGGQHFQDDVETAKMLGLTFAPKKRAWIGEAPLLNSYIEEFSTVDSVEVDEWTQERVAEFIRSLSELQRITKRSEARVYKPELMKLGPLPDKLTHDPLRSYQYTDLLRILNQNRFACAWTMGLGKSWETAAILEHLRDLGEIDKCVVFSSNIGVYNLTEELIKFGASQKRDEIMTIGSVSDVSDRGVFSAYPKIRTFVMTYDTYRRIFDYYKAKKQKLIDVLISWFGEYKGCVFFDECHLIGSPTSLRAKAILKTVDAYHYRYLFSGTFADKYAKLYIPSRVLDPSLVDGLSYHAWLEQYCELGNKYSKYAVNENSWDLKKLDALNKRLLEYSSKRGVECLDVPEQYEVPTIQVAMSPEHRAIYEAFSYFVVDDVRAKNEANGLGWAANLTSSFQFAQLSCDNPKLLEQSPRFSEFPPDLQKNIVKFNYEKSFTKLRVLDDILSTHCDDLDEAVIVWYYHPLSKDALVKHLAARHPFVVSSELSKEERQQTIDAFKQQTKSKVIIMSIVSASTSITLIEAKAMVFYETSWAYVDYSQASGRIQRPGQDKETRVYTCRFSKSVDSLQQHNLATKGKVINDLLSRPSLTKDDWKKLFSFSASD